MSTEALSWAWKREAPSAGRKLVLVALADAASEEGVCWPSYKHLAAKTGLSGDTVRQYVRDLEAEGVLAKAERKRENGSRSSNEYRLLIGPPLGTEQQAPGDGATGGGGDGATGLQVEPKEGTQSEPGTQASMLPAPTALVAEHWLARSGERRVDAQQRKVISDALKVRPVEVCCAAIDGLFADPWWRDNRPKLELRYALRGNRQKGESDGDRIDKMAANGPTQRADGRSSLTELLLIVSPSVRPMVLEDVAKVRRMYQNPTHGPTARLGQQALETLRRKPARIEPVLNENGALMGWQRVKS